jgi:hypothetical protein
MLCVLKDITRQDTYGTLHEIAEINSLIIKNATCTTHIVEVLSFPFLQNLYFYLTVIILEINSTRKFKFVSRANWIPVDGSLLNSG